MSHEEKYLAAKAAINALRDVLYGYIYAKNITRLTALQDQYQDYKAVYTTLRKDWRTTIINRKDILYKGDLFPDLDFKLTAEWAGVDQVLEDPYTSEERVVPKVDQVQWDTFNPDQISAQVAQGYLERVVLLRSASAIPALVDYLIYNDATGYYYRASSQERSTTVLDIPEANRKPFDYGSDFGFTKASSILGSGIYLKWEATPTIYAAAFFLTNTKMTVTRHAPAGRFASTDVEITVDGDNRPEIVVAFSLLDADYRIMLLNKELDAPEAAVWSVWAVHTKQGNLVHSYLGWLTGA